MRLDVVSIFPEYLAPLRLSLIGRAVRDGALDLAVHDLRAWTHDRHRTVDDTPYGGGAGMVMLAEPWAEALTEISSRREEDAEDAEVPADRPVLLVPSPAGTPFTQQMAKELAGRAHLVIACGRYEGIDQRVVDWAAERYEVRLVSIGDYVLNGGEVAALVMIEAIARLIPGIIGNPESLTEESHEDGLLEYPVYTKPAVWRGREVPEILLSGNHAAIDRWRRDQRLLRTVRTRPDLIAALGEDALDPHDRAVLAEHDLEQTARAGSADDTGIAADRAAAGMERASAVEDSGGEPEDDESGH